MAAFGTVVQILKNSSRAQKPESGRSLPLSCESAGVPNHELLTSHS